MRIRVRVDPWLPLVAGFILRLDDGNRVWIQCRYERVHKVCTKCGLMGHTRTQCTYLMEDVEQLLHRQRQRIQDQFHVPYGFDPFEPHFVDEIRAFYNRLLRRNTQIRFGPLQRYTGYRHRQYQQGGAPPPQPNMQSFMDAVEQDMQRSHSEGPHPTQEMPLHTEGTQSPHQHTPHTQDPAQVNNCTQPTSPNNSNLHWVWIENEGPFLTNTTLDPVPSHQENLNALNFAVTFETTGLAETPNLNLQQ